MRSVKLLLTGALLILLGPVMHSLDVMFSGFHLICWVIGIPVFIAGWILPEKTDKGVQSNDLPQKKCPSCGSEHDFDYPKCPFCGHDYQARQIK